MRATAPILMCDDESCGDWEVDHYATGASSVGGVRVSPQQRAPGWVTNDAADTDFCPRHAPEAGAGQ